MLRFEKYKNVGKMMFGEKTKKVIGISVLSFLMGVSLTSLVILIANKVSIQNGVGGLETAGVPEFTETMLDELQVSESVNVADENADVALSSDGIEGENVSMSDVAEDNLDAAAAVFSEDNADSMQLFYNTYRVKKGDMIGHIAETFNVTQDTIISVNDIHQSRLLQINQYLKIPSIPGICYTVRKNGETISAIAEKYEVSAEKCATINKKDANAKLVAGTNIFIPDAQLDWVTRQEINGDLFLKPIRNRYWLSSYFGWRSSPFSGKRSYHSGIDMACPMGTAVYASLGGTVTSVGFNNVYGNYIIITHHSGYKTLYGHLSAQLVSAGQRVSTNTKIGKVGSTGLSTGPHLHFTVYKFGKTVNPLGLIK